MGEDGEAGGDERGEPTDCQSPAWPRLLGDVTDDRAADWGGADERDRPQREGVGNVDLVCGLGSARVVGVP